MAADLDPRFGKGKIWLARVGLIILLAALVLPRYFGKWGQGPVKKPIAEVILAIGEGDVYERIAAMNGLRAELTTPSELAQVFPHLIRNMKDKAEPVRIGAASAAGGVIGRARALKESDATVKEYCSKAEAGLVPLLDDPSPNVRLTAAKSLWSVAMTGKPETPPPALLAKLEDDHELVRVAAVEAVTEYRQGPELFVPIALRRLPAETPNGKTAFRDVFWHIRLEPSIVPALVEGLSSENPDVRLSCTAAINHMGQLARPALPAILTTLRKELETPHPAGSESVFDTIGMASGAVGELIGNREEPPAGTVELLCGVLALRGTTPETNPDPKRLESENLFRIQEALFSLGILGPFAKTAVPQLLSTFESKPKARALTAEALVEITKGTPDEDKVIATLANAWKTATPEQKPVFARALRNLGPKSEQAVPELKQIASDGSRTEIRRVRYPRSRGESPVRE